MRAITGRSPGPRGGRVGSAGHRGIERRCEYPIDDARRGAHDRIDLCSAGSPEPTRARGMTTDDERIALFLDYENLAIGARDGLGVAPFDFGPVADALAERGRVVARRAYADWSFFDDDRRLLTRAQVELIEIPQRVGGSRKNAADIKMAVDAIELAYERPFLTTFAIGTGDSDFTPLVHKLREMDKRVIGIGVQSSTSALLPPACDEFLFYDRLPGVEKAPVEPGPVAAPTVTPDQDVAPLVTTTLAGLARHADGPVLASRLKRAVL